MNNSERLADNSIRVAIDIDAEICEVLDRLRLEFGLSSRGSLVNQLLREILLAEEGPAPEETSH